MLNEAQVHCDMNRDKLDKLFFFLMIIQIFMMGKKKLSEPVTWQQNLPEIWVYMEVYMSIGHSLLHDCRQLSKLNVIPLKILCQQTFKIYNVIVEPQKDGVYLIW